MGKMSWKVKVSHPCVSAPKFRGCCHLGSVSWGLHLCPLHSCLADKDELGRISHRRQVLEVIETQLKTEE